MDSSSAPQIGCSNKMPTEVESVMKAITSLGLLLIAGLSGCGFMSHTHCDDTMLSQEKSPDGKFVAVLYHRSCANHTGLYTVVDVREISEPSLSRGETKPVLTIRGFHEISGVWVGPNRLEIRSEGLQDQKAILTQESNWKAISISYRR